MARIVDGIPEHLADRRDQPSWSVDDVHRFRALAAEAGVSRRELARLMLKSATVEDVVKALDKNEISDFE